MPFRITSPIGPVLFLDDVAGSQLLLSALFITARDDEPPPIATAAGETRATRLAGYDHACVWRARFTLPADRQSEYSWNGATYAVTGDLT